MIAHSISPNPAVDRNAPTVSAGAADGFFDSGTSTSAATNPATTIGTGRALVAKSW
jgi:hypothetical protein